MASHDLVEASPRGRRPRDRKAQILLAAAARFHHAGYHRVAMEDIASDVGITAGALYRHFRSKQELLGRSIAAGLDLYATATNAAADLDGLLHAMASLALDRRDLPMLFQRELRVLPPPDAATARHAIRRSTHRIRQVLQAHRTELTAPDAELLSWATVGVFSSPSYHRVERPRPDFDALLQRTARAVCEAPIDDSDSVPDPHQAEGHVGLVPTSRREQLLAAAVLLFNERGYHDVSLADIGAAAGMAGPSVYNHFNSKADLLIGALNRGAETLSASLSRALRTSTSPVDALDVALRSYIGLAVDQAELVGLLVTEVGNLPAEQRRAIRHAERDYTLNLTGLLTQFRPELHPLDAQLLIHSALTIVNSVIRVGHKTPRPMLPQRLAILTNTVVHS